MTDTIPATDTGLPNRRRAFLRQLASVTLVGGAVALAADRAGAASTSPDAALIALGAELRTPWDAEKAVFAFYRDDESEEADAIALASIEETSLVVDKIEVLTATTFEGLKVKALALWWASEENPMAAEDFVGRSTEKRLAVSILRDLLATGA